MQWIGRILRSRRAFLAPVALVLFASIAVAASSEISLPSGNFDVRAVVTPGSAGGGVEFTGHAWDEKIDMSIGIDGDGDVTVNGTVIGSVDVSTACRIVARFVHDANGDYVVDVYVSDAQTGAPICSKTDVAVSGDVANAKATGLTVHSLSAS